MDTLFRIFNATSAWEFGHDRDDGGAAKPAMERWLTDGYLGVVT